MAEARTVWCLALGDNTQPFSVKVAENASVDDLKKALATSSMHDIAARYLKLYLAIKSDYWLAEDDDDLKALSDPAQDSDVVARYVNPNNLMKATKKVSNYFGDTQYPAFDQDGRIHVVAVLPTAERGTKLRKPEPAAVTLAGLWEYSQLLDKLPPTLQLKECLDKPLPFRLELQHPEVSKDLFEPSAPLVACPKLATIIDSIVWQLKAPISSNASENSWIPFYHNFLFITTELCRAHGLHLDQGRNVADPSLTTKKSLRPDYLLLQHKRVLLRGEEKRAQEDIRAPLLELTEKMCRWNALLYGNLPFILGYATSGSVIKLVSIEPSNSLNCFSRELVEFDFLLEAAKAVRVFCNLAFLLSKMVRLTTYDDGCGLLSFTSMADANLTIQLLDGAVQRTIHVAPKRLVRVYKTLEGLNGLGSSVTHLPTVNDMTTSKQSLAVRLSPIGYVRHPRGDEAVEWLGLMLTALKHWHRTGYCHGDVRWPNMVFVPQDGDARGYWLLIDMDQAHEAGTATIDWECHTYKGQCLDFHHDLFQLGECLGSLPGVLPAKLQTMYALLLSAVHVPFNVDAALSKLDELVQGTQ